MTTVEVEKLITLDEAAAIAHRAVVSLRSAALEGRLVAWRVGPTYRGLWLTTEDELSKYLARAAQASGAPRGWYRRSLAESESKAPARSRPPRARRRSSPASPEGPPSPE